MPQFGRSRVGRFTVADDLAVNGGDITSTATAFNLLDSVVTTLNLGGAATALNMGTAAGTVTIAGSLTVSGSVTVDVNETVTGNVTVTGDLAVNGGDIASTATTFNLLNATVTTLNLGGAVTTLNLGAAAVNINLTAGAMVFNESGADVDFRFEGDTEANLLVLDAGTGNVGIGTAGPIAPLNVQADRSQKAADLSDPAGQTMITGATDSRKRLILGYDTTWDVGFVNAGQRDVAWTNLVLQGGGGNVGIGTVSPDRLLHPELADAVTAAVSYPFRLTHITSGTPANSIGVGLEFEQETSADNNEVIATIEAVVTDVTATSEDADLVFKVMAAGAAASEQFRIASDGGLFAQTLLQQSAAGLVVEWDSSGKEIYAETSALRFKADVEPFYAPNVLALTPRRWTDKVSGRSEFGLIAEEVAEIYPDLCVYDGEGKPLGVKYHKLAVALLQEVKDLRRQVELLQ